MKKTSRRESSKDRGRQPVTAIDGRRRLWMLAAVLVLAGVAAYTTSFRGALMGDDLDAFGKNPFVRSIWTSFSTPSDTPLASRPVASLTFALNYALAPPDFREVMVLKEGGGERDERFFQNVWGYHAANLAIHIAACLLLFGVVRRTLLSPVLRARFGDASLWLAWSVSLLWLVHPLQTESVTFLVQRVESLMGFFYLATLYCAIRAAEFDFKAPFWIAGAIVACALGMGTKEAMVTAPLTVTAWIWIFRPDLKLWGPPWRLLLGLAASWMVVAWLLTTASRSMSVGFGLGGWTAWIYLRTQCQIIVHYLQLVFWPHPLVFHYAWMAVRSWGDVLPELLLLGSLGIATVVALVRRWPIGILGVWFFLILAPASSILPVVSEVAAEHRMYLPLAAVITLLVVGSFWVFSSFRPAHTSPAVRQLAAVAGGVMVCSLAVVLGLVTHGRNHAYESVETMTADIVAGRPENAQAQMLRGVQLIGGGRFTEAETHLRIALDKPLPLGTEARMRAPMHMYLAMTLLDQQKTDEGLEHLQRAEAIDPALADTYDLFATAYLRHGRERDALAALERGIAATPDPSQALGRAALILSASADDRLRNGARAVQFAERAVALTHGQDPVALASLAAAYAEAGQFDKAIATTRSAMEITASNPSSGLKQVLQSYLALFEAHRPVRITSW